MSKPIRETAVRNLWVIQLNDGRFLCPTPGDGAPAYWPTDQLLDAALFNDRHDARQAIKYWTSTMASVRIVPVVQTVTLELGETSK